MDRKGIVEKFRKDTGCESVVSTIVCQKMLWAKYYEYCIYTDDMKRYSAMFDDEAGDFTTCFEEVKPRQEGK